MLEALIDECIDIKKGDKDFGLFFYGDFWVAEIGNPSPHVSLGEASGEFRAEGATAKEAVEALMSQLKGLVSDDA